MQESRQATGRLSEEHHVAKAGGKAERRSEKRSAKDKDGARAKPGADRRAAAKAKAAKPAKTKPGKSKLGKAKRPRGAQHLVERVAAEIVAAELDRAVGEAAAIEAEAKQDAATLEVVEPDSEPGPEPESRSDSDSGSGGKIGALLRLAAGPVDLAAVDAASTPGVSSRAKAEAQLPGLALRLEELQERLFAAARGGQSKRRVLLVLQGMDTSGKGGTVRHVVGQLDPNGTRLTAFKAPTEEERAHDFLWRIRNALPVAGEVGIFDRSHYEDVLIARVRKLALPMVIGRRYQLINKFEQNLAADGAVVVKCFLHISAREQKERLLARLDDPRKQWKYNPGDVDERALWPQYQEAYQLALEKCSTEAAPWHVVPADHKWYRNYAITRLLVEALEQIDPQYPAASFDVELERKRVLAA
jgi:PPK2 family polyphosphate:nucleotide phosphotransferase